MHRGGFRRAGVLVLVAVPMLFATPASAKTATLKAVTGKIAFGSTSEVVEDGSCPNTKDPSFPPGTEEPHQIFSAAIARGGGFEALGVSVCYEVSGALGGVTVDKGTFKLKASGGALEGTVAGSVAFQKLNLFDLTLTVTHGSGKFRGITGALTFYGCHRDGGPIEAGGGVRMRPLDPNRYPHPYPPACFPPSS